MSGDSRKKEKKRDRRDRKDAYYVKPDEASGAIILYLSPKKMNNVININLSVDATEILDFVRRKKDEGYPNISIFSVILTSAVRLCAMRPKLNRFVKMNRLYERKEISMGFVAATSLDEEGKRVIMKPTFDPSVTVYEVADKIRGDVSKIRSGESWGTDSSIEKIVRYPRPVIKLIAWTVRRLDQRGWVPSDLIQTDPNHATMFISNMGSIGGLAPFHHLDEFGTNSIFACIGKVREEHRIGEDGTVSKVPIVDIALTIDERIADGIYFTKALEQWREMLTDPDSLCDRYLKNDK
ncbi:MAG: 2-oxo acid dehydrogenase subunit E2 [Candidatus Methanomethylophilaceae archaeon]|nr:2-oxo acid dehydrogenase subunit E2 [Candidatus Methanomethylophilaceae archaeon]